MQAGSARKLTVYISESDTRHGRPLYEVIVELARKRGLGGATAVRGLMGFGAGGTIHVAHPDLASQLPVRVEIIDSAAAIAEILGDVCDLAAAALVTVSDVEVVKGTAARERVPEPVHMALARQAQMLRVFVSATAEWQGRPLYEAIVARLKQLDVAGATVLPAERELVIIVVDAAQKLREIRPELEEMVGAGLIVSSDVDVVFYRGAERA
jgi:PII-like signaling protein